MSYCKGENRALLFTTGADAPAPSALDFFARTPDLPHPGEALLAPCRRCRALLVVPPGAQSEPETGA